MGVRPGVIPDWPLTLMAGVMPWGVMPGGGTADSLNIGIEYNGLKDV